MELLWASLPYIWSAPLIVSSGEFPTPILEGFACVRLVLWSASSSGTPIASPSGPVLGHFRLNVSLMCTAGSFGALVESVWEQDPLEEHGSLAGDGSADRVVVSLASTAGSAEEKLLRS